MVILCQPQCATEIEQTPAIRRWLDTDMTLSYTTGREYRRE